MDNMKTFLDKQLSIVINDQEILGHMLWADDLVLIANSVANLQRQLDGLYNFCGKYKVIVNTLKTKIMYFWETYIGIFKFHFQQL